MRGILALGLVCAVALGALAAPAGAATPDRLTAVNVVPPGESGNTTTAAFTAATSGAAPTYGPNTQDQEPLYANWQYKPMQFSGQDQGTPPPGDQNVTITRDATWAVPTITAGSDSDLFYGIGYAMAQDRLFQMEAFRHVGHGTLASLIGASGIPMDEQVRQVTEGPAGLQAEWGALPAADQARLQRFVDGLNAYIAQVQNNPLTQPAEFALLGDVPIQPWTVADVLGFGEYAGRFFGEFDGGELVNAVLFEQLVRRYGERRAQVIFNDLLPVNDPHAPTSIDPRDGRFPLQLGRRVKSRFKASPYANQAPSALPPLAQLQPVAAHVAQSASALRRLQRLLAIPRFGSNAVLVSGRLTRDHKAMLYGGPQTGWAVPGFFWEVELHSPGRDERGVMVPAIPLMVIGRNQDAAWTVTSALDANADTYTVQLSPDNSTYMYRGRRLRVQSQTETIPCSNPPSNAASLASGQAPQLCPSTPASITVYRTALGPAIAGPDSGHHLYVRHSVVDGRLVKSLSAWDAAGRQHTSQAFGQSLQNMSLGFNFFYADDHGTIAYWHTGAYPRRPANADPRLPLPGDGRYDWQGFQPWPAHPHVINPRSGYVVNWNNKPAVGWGSKNLLTGSEGGEWGDYWEVAPLAQDVPRRAPLTLQTLGQVPRDVAYVDDAARVFLPALRAALRTATGPQLAKIRAYLGAWDGNRDHVNLQANPPTYSTPAIAFFDRFMEHLLRDGLEPVLGSVWYRFGGLDTPTGHLTSVDNLTAPTYKFEFPGYQVLAAALHGHDRYQGWMRNRMALFRRAASDAAAELTATQGSDPAGWNEPAEQTTFSAQGAISVPPITPLMNRGSYGQVVEASG
ncbi:MAG TPA: penicillin acylase family protein [Solirubrobacteraceae bacterium]|nr:penicillin acylase family protein [Solirubrobacteraceae bacterium]